MQLRIEPAAHSGHNICMKRSFTASFLCAAQLFVAFSMPVHSQANDETFEIKKRNLEERFEDYYTRQVILEREAIEREKGSKEKSEERVREEAERERVRKQFVLERRSKPEQDPTLWERELQERKREYEKSREEFVRKMQPLKRLESELAIPGEEELGINSSPENL